MKQINSILIKINNLLSDDNDFDSVKYFNESASLYAAIGIIAGIAILINSFIDQHTFLNIPNGVAIVVLLKEALAASFLIFLLLSIYIIFKLSFYKTKYNEQETNYRNKLNSEIKSGNIDNDATKFITNKIFNFFIKNILLIGLSIIIAIIGIYILLTMVADFNYCLNIIGTAIGMIICIIISYLSRNVNNWRIALYWFIIGFIALIFYVVPLLVYNTLIPFVSFCLGFIGIIMVLTSIVLVISNIIGIFIGYKQKPIDENKGISRLPIIILIIVLFLIFSAISTTLSKDDPTLIIGQWNSYDQNNQIKYIFYADGTFSAYYNTMEVSGIWTSRGNMKYMILVDNSDNTGYFMNVTINRKIGSLEFDESPTAIFYNNTKVKYELYSE